MWSRFSSWIIGINAIWLLLLLNTAFKGRKTQLVCMCSFVCVCVPCRAVLCYAVLCAVWAAAVNAQFFANAFAAAVSSLFWFFLFKHTNTCLHWQTNPRNTWQMLFNAKQHNSNQCCLFWTRIRYNYEPHYHLHWYFEQREISFVNKSSHLRVLLFLVLVLFSFSIKYYIHQHLQHQYHHQTLSATYYFCSVCALCVYYVQCQKPKTVSN